MKANELMIGDWVEIQDTPRYYKVEGIDFFTKGGACRLTFEDYIVDTWCDRVNPIPLTEEILKANGFVIGKKDAILKDRSDNKHEQYDFWCNSCGEYGFGLATRLEENECGRMYPCEFLVIHYVHELQHALRLCGFKELADNFKLE